MVENEVKKDGWECGGEEGGSPLRKIKMRNLREGRCIEMDELMAMN